MRCSSRGKCATTWRTGLCGPSPSRPGGRSLYPNRMDHFGEREALSLSLSSSIELFTCGRASCRMLAWKGSGFKAHGMPSSLVPVSVGVKTLLGASCVDVTSVFLGVAAQCSVQHLCSFFYSLFINSCFNILLVLGGVPKCICARQTPTP